MKGKSTLFFILIATLPAAPQANSFDLPLSNYDGGVYKIQIPANWNIYTAGQCGELASVARDRENELNQIFFFGSIGPIYMSQEQKQIDWNYMNMGGYPVAWIEMPAINPLTPENFMLHFSEIAATRIAQQFMPQAPRLEKFNTISTTQMPSMIHRGKTDMIRALFTKQKKVGEGMFLCTVAPFMPFTGGPGGGNGYEFMVSGVTAAKSQFSKLLPILIESIGSFNPDYAVGIVTRVEKPQRNANLQRFCAEGIFINMLRRKIVKGALQPGFSGRSRWLLHNLGLRSIQHISTSAFRHPMQHSSRL